MLALLKLAVFAMLLTSWLGRHQRGGPTRWEDGLDVAPKRITHSGLPQLLSDLRPVKGSDDVVRPVGEHRVEHLTGPSA